MTWVYLLAAILFEVAATLSLRMVAHGKRVWAIVVFVGYGAALALISLALSAGMALGVAYGVWVAMGVALTAIFSRVLFKEPLTLVMGLGILLVASGVLLVELGSLA